MKLRRWIGTALTLLLAIMLLGTPRARAAVSDVELTTAESGGSVVVGFENHGGRTRLGSGVTPLGSVLKGYGNNGSDGTEGVRWNNVYGTYSHGPVLPKNPEFCDHILGTALERKYGVRDLAPLDDRAENAAREVMLRRLHVN